MTRRQRVARESMEGAVARAASSLLQQGLHAHFEPLTETLLLTFFHYQTDRPIDLSGLPAGLAVQVSLEGPWPNDYYLALRGTGRTLDLSIELPTPTYARQPGLARLGVRGFRNVDLFAAVSSDQFVFETPFEASVSAEFQDVDRVSVYQAIARINSLEDSDLELLVSDAAVRVSGTVPSLVLRGLVVVESAARIKELLLDDDATLICGDLASESIELRDYRLTLRGKLSPEQDLSDVALTAHGIKGPGEIFMDEGSTCSILQEARRIRIAGGELLVASRATVRRIQFWRSRNGSLPVLNLSPLSTVRDVVGDVRIRKINHASIYGLDPNSTSVTSPDHRLVIVGLTEESPEKALEAATLVDFLVPDGPESGYLWNALGDAAYVAPRIDRTAAVRYRGSFKIPSWVPKVGSTEATISLVTIRARSIARVALDRDVVEDDYRYVRGASDVCAAKGAPGSTRSQAAWSVYRLRSLLGVPRGERVLLWGYRLIGYGERPAPAFVTWLLGVVTATAWSLDGTSFDPSFFGVWRVAGHLAFWAVPSFGLLSLPELPQGVTRSIGTFLIHAGLAVPFLTAWIAVRNYVKYDRRSG